MSITVAQLPGYLDRLGEKAGLEAPLRAVHAMGDAYTREVVQSMRGRSPSPPGSPPARVTGTLARSVRQSPAVRAGAYAFRCQVAPHTVYARIQQRGGDIYPVRARALHWTDEFGSHFSMHVRLPARPYMVMSPAARTACHNAARDAVEALLP